MNTKRHEIFVKLRGEISKRIFFCPIGRYPFFIGLQKFRLSKRNEAIDIDKYTLGKLEKGGNVKH